MRRRHGNRPSPADTAPPRSVQGADVALPIPALSPAVTAALVFCAAAVCYVASYDGDFVFDDAEAVLGNKDVTPDVPWTDLFSHDFWGNKMTSNTSHKSYRPLTVLTLRWSHWLADGFHPRGFHIVNILLHGFICVLLLPVLDLLLEVKGQGHFSRMSTLCALMFAVHPVHTESVAAVVGRADLLCAATFLLSILAYHRASQHPGAWCGPWLGASMVLCVISTLCKEIGITVLAVCVVYDVIVNCNIDPLVYVGLRTTTRLSHPASGQKSLYSIPNANRPLVSPLPVLRITVVMVTGVLLLIGRWQVMGSQAPTFQVIDNPHSFVTNPFLRVLNYNYLYSINMWLLLNPCWLCFDWSMGCVPVIESFVDPRLLAVCAFWFVSGSLIGYCLVQSPGKEQRQMMMGLSLLVLPFLPASNLLFRVGFVIAERVLYLPSLGFIILQVLGLSKLNASHRFRKVCPALIVLLLASHGFRSHTRSLQWRTEKTLFESGALVCPLNAKVQYNIAKINTDAGNLDYAIEKYKLAIRLNPQYDQAMNNLGNILKDIGQLEEAEQLLVQATQIRPEFAAAWMNLGIVQATLNRSVSAELSYQTALRHRRNYPDCYYNLGNLYLSETRHAHALAAWRNATLQKPAHISAWTNIIILLDNLGRLPDVLLVAKEAIAHNPMDPSIHYNVGNALGKAGQYEEAEPYFLKAIELQPDTASYHSNLAVLYHRWGELNQAEKHYKQALNLDPDNAQIQQNYNMLHKKSKKGS